MGALAEAMVAYAQPLLDQSDGTEEGMQWAFTLASLCFTMAQVSTEVRQEMLAEMRQGSDFSDEEFRVFLNDIVYPMIERQREMFPQRNANVRKRPAVRVMKDDAHLSPTLDEEDDVHESNVPEPRPYAPCTCGSGLKYKFCCRKKPRAR